MKKYARLAALVLVLSLSVGVLAAVIDLLGDITRLNLDQGGPATSLGLAEAAGLTRGGESTPLGLEAKQQGGPIAVIRLPPRTAYLRRYAFYNYSGGLWWRERGLEWVEYGGELLELGPGLPPNPPQTQFLVEPLVNLTGFMLVPQHTDYLGLNDSTTIYYYPEIQCFEAQEAYDEAYWVSYKRYEASANALKASEARGPPEALQVPEELGEELRQLAEEVAGGQGSDYDRLVALADYLKENYEFDKGYMGPPPGVDPIHWFLFQEGRGVASHFNTALVLLARSLGIPVRAVTGYLVRPDLEVQYVLPQQTHFYAEAYFEGLGWVTLDASPTKTEEEEVEANQEPTICNITGWDAVAIRGEEFHVWGTVKTLNGTGVEGVQVEVWVMQNKTAPLEEGVLVGVAETAGGVFNATCVAGEGVWLGDYSLVAHSLETPRYMESYSDPQLRVVSRPHVEVKGPQKVYPGVNVTYTVALVDGFDGHPIANASIEVATPEGLLSATTDPQGRARLTLLFPETGETQVEVSHRATPYTLGAAQTLTVSVVPPPPDPSFLLSLLRFPYNIILALTGAIGVGVAAARRRRGLGDEPALQEKRGLAPIKEYIGFEDGVPLEYKSYEEGVVKLFNRFFVSARRRFPEIDESLTPREFQAFLEERLPPTLDAMLEDLVSSYEVAMYSNLSLDQDDFKRTHATIEFIVELMKDGGEEEQPT